MTDSQFATEMRVARALHRWSQRDLGKKLGVSATYISLLENKKRRPSWDFVRKFARVAGLTICFQIKQPRRTR